MFQQLSENGSHFFGTALKSVVVPAQYSGHQSMGDEVFHLIPGKVTESTVLFHPVDDDCGAAQKQRLQSVVPAANSSCEIFLFLRNSYKRSPNVIIISPANSNFRSHRTHRLYHDIYNFSTCFFTYAVCCVPLTSFSISLFILSFIVSFASSFFYHTYKQYQVIYLNRIRLICYK